MQKAQDQRYDVLQSSSELGWVESFRRGPFLWSWKRGAPPLSRRPKSQSCLMDRKAPPAAESVEAGGCRSTYSFVGSVVRLEDSTEHVSDWHMKARLRYAPVSPNTHRRSSKLRSVRLR
jgi:hypothetical protein